MAGDHAAGRPRDADLDRAILAAALAILAEAGFDGLSIAAVAERASTTRPAIYRRHPDKASLAVAALTTLSRDTAPVRTDDPRADLAAELTSFRDGITAGNGMSLAAAILQDSTDPAVVAAYREGVVAPRRTRIAAILADARAAGDLVADDRSTAIAVTMCTGSWYAFALAGEQPPADWPTRTADVVWRSLGGVA